MNASSLTERLRTMTNYAWFRDKPDYKKDTSVSTELRQSRMVGSLYFVDITTPSVPEQESYEARVHIYYTLDEAVFLALTALLNYGAANNLGPTRCARLNFLWFHTVTSGYNWIATTAPRLTGTLYNWDWNTRTPLASETDQFVWVNRVLAHIMPSFVPGYDTTSLLENERQAMGWSVDRQTAEVSRIQAAGDWAGWQAAWTTWWSLRVADLASPVLDPPTLAQKPNGETFLEVSDTVDPSTYTHPDQWTPLKIGTKSPQTYLTYNWSSIPAAGLSASDETDIQAAAAAHVPTAIERADEIDEVLTISENLTDEEKISAEFWAGGSSTVSPPGMFVWMWRELATDLNLAHTRGFDVFFFSGLDLTLHIFETSRMVWELKKLYMQARPIQEIRRTPAYRSRMVTRYDGAAILGRAWVPYQEPDFVSPPFADFPSGHSGFSRSFALVMEDWFGNTIPTTEPRVRADMSLLSPALNASQTTAFGVFTFPAGASLIQPAVVPSTEKTLQWPTWAAMAESAGISRKYGGIHATSAHTGSVAVSDTLHTRLRASWAMVVG